MGSRMVATGCHASEACSASFKMALALDDREMMIHAISSDLSHFAWIIHGRLRAAPNAATLH
jgi:hypothetical protein